MKLHSKLLVNLYTSSNGGYFVMTCRVTKLEIETGFLNCPNTRPGVFLFLPHRYSVRIYIKLNIENARSFDLMRKVWACAYSLGIQIKLKLSTHTLLLFRVSRLLPSKRYCYPKECSNHILMPVYARNLHTHVAVCIWAHVYKHVFYCWYRNHRIH